MTLLNNSVQEWSVGGGQAGYSANGWKWAALIDDNYYGNSPDITFQLIDKCPVGGGEVVLRTAAKYALKARMRVNSANIAADFHGRCLYVRATVNHATEPVLVYMADYLFSNGRIIHAAN